MLCCQFATHFVLALVPTITSNAYRNLIYGNRVSAINTQIITKKLALASQQFEFVQCESFSDMLISQRIRYQVYCAELGWQQPTAKNMESDCYDAESIHYLAFDKATGKAVATFRLIAGKRLPVEDIDIFNTDNDSHPKGLQNESLCEISRFSVLPEYRHQDLHQALILFAAYSAIQNGYTTMYSIMEHKFASMLKKLNILVSQLTDTFDYRGKRAIFMVRDSDVLPLLTCLVENHEALSALENIFGCLNHFQQRHCA
jgi:N-acyl-L-homoserine lactone synthetase